LLLSRDLKRNLRLLPKVAIWMIGMRWDLSDDQTGIHSRAIPSWIDFDSPSL
jgi:hypothetical protein